jgi:hypothetical protein
MGGVHIEHLYGQKLSATTTFATFSVVTVLPVVVSKVTFGRCHNKNKMASPSYIQRLKGTFLENSIALCVLLRNNLQ